jgi:hypothetical protein
MLVMECLLPEAINEAHITQAPLQLQFDQFQLLNKAPGIRVSESQQFLVIRTVWEMCSSLFATPR